MSEGETKVTAPVLSFNFPNPPRDWNEGWQAFRQAHPNWPPAGESAAPLYCLPLPAITQLARLPKKGPAALGTTEAAAEQQFTTLCAAHFAVGCWPVRPVRYDLLKALAPPPKEILRAAGWSP